MKKITSVIVFAGFSIIMYSSCTKCSTCQYSYKYLGKDSTRVFAEQCGNKKELDNYKSTVNQAASADNGATVSCTDK